MFGNYTPPLSQLKPQRKVILKDMDISMPHHDGVYGHRAREPNTDHIGRTLHTNQQTTAKRIAAEIADKNRSSLFARNLEFELRTDRHCLTDRVKAKVNEKIQKYIESVDKRRDKLRNLLAEEEEQYVRETVDMSLKARESRIEEMMIRSKELKEAKERERIEIVKQKRLQQYTLRCLEVRPFFTKKLTEESKLCQLQQMRENEARRQSEKEIAKMWDDMAKKQNEAFMQREVQEAIIKYNRCKKDMDILTMQIRAKKLMNKENEELEKANAQEYQRLFEMQNQQEQEEKMQKFQKSVQDAEDLKKQMALHKQFRDQRKKEEAALDNAFAALAKLELERELSGVVDNRDRLRMELETYKHHLQHLKQREKEEEEEVERIIENYRKEQQQRDDEATCKVKLKRLKLQEQVLQERAAQVEYNRKKAQRELEAKQFEVRMMREICEVNRKLHEESQRLERNIVKQYRSELVQQIEYNTLLKKREMEEAERRLQEGIEEERKLEELVREIVKVRLTSMNGHPIRQLLHQFDCGCNDKN